MRSVVPVTSGWWTTTHPEGRWTDAPGDWRGWHRRRQKSILLGLVLAPGPGCVVGFDSASWPGLPHAPCRDTPRNISTTNVCECEGGSICFFLRRSVLFHSFTYICMMKYHPLLTGAALASVSSITEGKGVRGGTVSCNHPA